VDPHHASDRDQSQDYDAAGDSSFHCAFFVVALAKQRSMTAVV
jgi:hypothetical protein